jgi:hypothetical protein
MTDEVDKQQIIDERLEFITLERIRELANQTPEGREGLCGICGANYKRVVKIDLGVGRVTEVCARCRDKYKLP